MKQLIVTFFFSIIWVMAFSQNPNHQSQVWFQYKGSINKKESKWHFSLDLQHRRDKGLLFSSQHIVRPGIGYQINDNVSLVIGNALFLNKSDQENPLYFVEIRPYQFLNWNVHFTSFSIKNKIRLEQRFREVASDSEKKKSFALYHRTGYRVDFVFPVTPKMSLILSEEILIHLTKYNAVSTIDQNRIYGGIQHQYQNMTFQMGYLWAWLPKDGPSLNQHIIRVGVSHKW